MRRAIAAFNARDWETVRDLQHPNVTLPDAELITDPLWMEAGPFQGRAALRSWFEGLAEPWNGRDELVLRELFELGNKVVLRFDWQVRGGKRGLGMTLDATCINMIEQGLIARQQYFFDYAAALKAAGLEE
jgi:hypothetical protein